MNKKKPIRTAYSIGLIPPKIALSRTNSKQMIKLSDKYEMTVQLLERKRHTNQFEHEMYRRATSHKMCIDPKTQTKQFLSIRYDFFPIALSCAGSIGTKRIFIVCDENFIVQVTALLVLIA